MDFGSSHGNREASSDLGFHKDSPVQKVEKDFSFLLFVHPFPGAPVIHYFLIRKMDFEKGRFSSYPGPVSVTIKEAR